MARAVSDNPTPLQAAIKQAIDAAPKSRDYYDRELQRLTGKTGKQLYDIERGKSLNPGADKLKLIAKVMGLPEMHFLQLASEQAPAANAKPFEMEGASEERMKQDVPILGTALGADKIIDGEAIEQTYLNSGEVVGYLRRPVLLDGRTDVYGIYVQGSSMHPRFKDGATLFVERKRPARIGDDVVVYLRGDDGCGGERTQCVLVKELVRKSGSYVELLQYEPRHTFKIEAARIERIDRVIPWDELVA